MHAFSYVRVDRVEDALAAARDPDSKFLAGGTNLLDLMKGYVEQPRRIVDVNHLPLQKIHALPDGGVRIGALARNSDTANHPLIRRNYPLLTQALLAGASPQLRTWPRSEVISCSVPGATISPTLHSLRATS